MKLQTAKCLLPPPLQIKLMEANSLTKLVVHKMQPLVLVKHFKSLVFHNQQTKLSEVTQLTCIFCSIHGFWVPLWRNWWGSHPVWKWATLVSTVTLRRSTLHAPQLGKIIQNHFNKWMHTVSIHIYLYDIYLYVYTVQLTLFYVKTKEIGVLVLCPNEINSQVIHKLGTVTQIFPDNKFLNWDN